MQTPPFRRLAEPYVCLPGVPLVHGRLGNAKDRRLLLRHFAHQHDVLPYAEERALIRRAITNRGGKKGRAAARRLKAWGLTPSFGALVRTVAAGWPMDFGAKPTPDVFTYEQAEAADAATARLGGAPPLDWGTRTAIDVITACPVTCLAGHGGPGCRRP